MNVIKFQTYLMKLISKGANVMFAPDEDGYLIATDHLIVKLEKPYIYISTEHMKYTRYIHDLFYKDDFHDEVTPVNYDLKLKRYEMPTLYKGRKMYLDKKLLDSAGINLDDYHIIHYANDMFMLVDEDGVMRVTISPIIGAKED